MHRRRVRRDERERTWTDAYHGPNGIIVTEPPEDADLIVSLGVRASDVQVSLGRFRVRLQSSTAKSASNVARPLVKLWADASGVQISVMDSDVRVSLSYP